MTEVEIHGLSKSYSDGRKAVLELDWKLRTGALTVLVGASGSGKTTLLRLLAGLERPTSGKIYCDGEDQSTYPPHRRDVALVPQSPGLFPQWTVRQNMEVTGSSAARLSSERVTEIARLLEIESLLERYPGEISGGEQQRVSLGRALVRRPRILLLDEPLGQLDGWLRHEVRQKLQCWQRESRVTTLLVTHDPDEALSLADELAVMDGGRLLQSDVPAKVVGKPAHVQIARLFARGGLNLWQGEIAVDGKTWSFVTQGWRWELPAGCEPSVKAGQVWLGVSSADFFVREAEGSTKQEGWPFSQGVIANVGVSLGGRRMIAVALAGSSVVCRAALEADGTLIGQVGDGVELAVRPGSLHYFSAPDGWRIVTPSASEGAAV